MPACCRALLAVACAAAFAVSAPVAEAGLAFETKWGSQGSGPGQFDTPEGVGGGVFGDVFASDQENDRVQKFTSDGTFVTAWGSFGSANGRFSRPGGIAVDMGGNVYVADTGNNRIQKFNSDGVFLSKIGGFGSGNGQFMQPYGVAVDSSGNLFVTDTGNNRIQKFTAAGAFVMAFGFGRSSADGGFDSPVGVGVDFAGDIYVSDAANHRIQKFDGTGAFLTKWGTLGSGPTQFNVPYGLAVGVGGTVTVADSGNHRLQQFSTDGVFFEQTGQQGSGDGEFQTPTGVALDSVESIYVADTFNHRVQKFNGGGTGIVLRKNAVPDDPQDFDFTAGGGLSPSSFQLDDDGNSGNGLSNVRTFAVAAGSGYSLAEGSAPPGWDQASATCSDGSPPSNIDVSEGEIVTCTFTNNKRGRVVVVQDSLPDDPQDFDFTAGGGLTPTSFQLDDDGDNSNALSNSRSFENLLPGSGYSVSQTTPAGWSSEATCSDGSSPGNIDVGPGETVTCTFSNVSPTAARITVVKDAQPNEPQDFSFAAGGMSPSSFQLDDDGDNSNALSNQRSFIVAPGSGYSLSETVPAGWLLASATCSDGSPVTNIDVSGSELVTCTFTNQRPGAVIVRKDAQPNDPQDFDFTAGGGLTPTTFQLDDDSNGTLSNSRTFSGVAPGAGYSVAETMPSGWEQGSVTCSDGSPASNIDVAPAETVTCTFENRKLAQINVVKNAVPDDPQDFGFTAAGGLSPGSFQLDDDGDNGNALSNARTFSDLPAGSGYSIAETVPGGWHQSSATCSDSSPVSNVSLSPGESVTCTFTNLKRGTITIVQDTRPDGPQDFGYTTGGGLSPSSFQLDDDGDDLNGLARSIVLGNIVPGAGYSVSQTPVPGWLLEDSSCSDGSSLSNIDVAPGEQITCTFGNSVKGRIIVRKDARPDSSRDFDFTTGGGLTPASFQLDDDSDDNNGLASSRVFLVDAGSGYSVSEAPPGTPDWELESANCSDGSPVSNIDLAAGEIVTCTFVNKGRIGNYPRPKGATPLRVGLVTAFNQCTVDNRTHGPPLTFPSCNPPVQRSTAVTVGSPDANGAPANSESRVRYDVLFAPGGVDDTDVRIEASITDLRCKAGTTACGNANAADGADYIGQVQATTVLRITDPLSTESATMSDTGLHAPFQCASTASSAIGGSCMLNTTVDALIPGAVPEGRRSVWEMGPVQLFDGGADGQLSTSSGNALLLVQGTFVP